MWCDLIRNDPNYFLLNLILRLLLLVLSWQFLTPATSTSSVTKQQDPCSSREWPDQRHPHISSPNNLGPVAPKTEKDGHVRIYVECFGARIVGAIFAHTDAICGCLKKQFTILQAHTFQAQNLLRKYTRANGQTVLNSVKLAFSTYTAYTPKKETLLQLLWIPESFTKSKSRPFWCKPIDRQGTWTLTSAPNSTPETPKFGRWTNIVFQQLMIFYIVLSCFIPD